MTYVQGIREFSHPLSPIVLTIGNFDGVHLGHQCIVQMVLQRARSLCGKSVAFTFRPHPQAVLRPAAPLQLLTTYDEKVELLNQLGLDFVIEEPFDHAFAQLEPYSFFKDLILARIRPQVIIVGYDFSFGRGRQGHLQGLGEFCKQGKIELVIVEPQVEPQEQDQMGLRRDPEVISSSRIRTLLNAGYVEEAQRLLGRPFSYRGVVVRGDGRGRQLGFPTANVPLSKLGNKLMLPQGVYATKTLIQGQRHLSVTNVGVRPTFQSPGVENLSGLEPRIETHLLDASRDLYGLEIEIDFVQKLREERKFSDIQELKRQIAQDIQFARKIFK